MSWLSDILAATDIASKAGSSIWSVFSQKKTWEREDNAVQRRAADLEKAGFNPLLATGSAAQASAPIKVGFPDDSFDKYAQAKMLDNQIKAQENNIALTKAQEALTNEQLAKVSMENLPMKTLLSKNWKVGSLRDEEADMSILDYLARNKLKEYQYAEDIRLSNAIAADWNSQIRPLEFKKLDLYNQLYGYDKDITEKMGVRSTDKVDAALEAVLRELGNEKGPWATTATSLLFRLLPYMFQK